MSIIVVSNFVLILEGQIDEFYSLPEARNRTPLTVF